ncbi:hypothetical protein AB2B38_006735 [Balneola sp. MJW-20]|uniref:hypothetical protein n=1 Tax=Gracilimonas aurantiaca TaxID=3234185 RepID=UPI003467C612
MTGNIKSGIISKLPGLQDTLAGAISVIYPPPFRREDMEFKYGAWAGSSTIHCADGRPIGEDNATPYYYRKATPTEYRAGTFKDSREDKCYNITALHHMMKDWDEIMVLVTELRSHFMEQYQIKGPSLSTRQLYIFSKLCVAINPYLVRHSQINVENGTLSPVLASLTKLITGIFMIIRHMIENGEQDLFHSSPADPEALFKYSDEHGLLISPRDSSFVCAGSQRKIIQFMDILINGGTNLKKEKYDAQTYLNMIGDLSACFSYGITDLQMELNLQLVQTELIEVFLDVKAHDGISGSDLLKKVLEHLQKYFPCSFLDRNKLTKQKEHLITLIKDTGGMPIEYDFPETRTENEFADHYAVYMENVRDESLNYQNTINRLLQRNTLQEIKLKHVHSRLNVVPVKLNKIL